MMKCKKPKPIGKEMAIYKIVADTTVIKGVGAQGLEDPLNETDFYINDQFFFIGPKQARVKKYIIRIQTLESGGC